MRARYATIDLSGQQDDGTYRRGPWILIAKSPPEQQEKKDEHGDRPLQEGLSFWTAGLGMFDPTIQYGTDEELIRGPEVLIKVLDGAMAESRYIATSWKWSDPFGYKIVQQMFRIRAESPEGMHSLVW